MLDPTARPRVQLVPMVRLLAKSGVDWVLTGSAVLAIYGAELVPNDLDVTPALDQDNLERLAAALESIEARPAFVPDWPAGPSLEQCREWTPRPVSEQRLDHLFVTGLGMLDVPPRLCGTYAELIGSATPVDVDGVAVDVCDPSEVLTRLEGRNRPKDLPRAAIYERLRATPPAELAPTGLPRLLDRLRPADTHSRTD